MKPLQYLLMLSFDAVVYRVRQNAPRKDFPQVNPYQHELRCLDEPVFPLPIVPVYGIVLL